MTARRQLKQVLAEKKEAIAAVTTDILNTGTPIVRAQQVQLAVEANRGLEVSTKLVRFVFRKELAMGYRVAKAVPAQCNLERVLVLRQ